MLNQIFRIFQRPWQTDPKSDKILTSLTHWPHHETPFNSSTESGCQLITTPDNGKITYLNAKASAMLFCEPNYESVGNTYAHCNGTHWDRGIGTCRETDNAPPTSCDFECELPAKHCLPFGLISHSFHSREYLRMDARCGPRFWLRTTNRLQQ